MTVCRNVNDSNGRTHLKYFTKCEEREKHKLENNKTCNFLKKGKHVFLRPSVISKSVLPKNDDIDKIS